MAGRLAPSWSCSGLVNSVHTYCGLEIDIIAIRPSPSWIQRVDVVAVLAAADCETETVMFAPPKPGPATLRSSNLQTKGRVSAGPER